VAVEAPPLWPSGGGGRQQQQTRPRGDRRLQAPN